MRISVNRPLAWLLLAGTALLFGCAEQGINPNPGSVDELAVPKAFDYSTTQDVAVRVKVADADGQALAGKLVAIYNAHPDADGRLLFRQLTDAQGLVALDLNLPADLPGVYIVAQAANMPPVVFAPVVAGQALATVFPGAPTNLQVEFAKASGVDDFTEQGFPIGNGAVQLYDNWSTTGGGRGTCPAQGDQNTFGTGDQWIGYVYDGNSFNPNQYQGYITAGQSGDPTFRQTFANTVNPYGCPTQANGFTVRYKLLKNFPKGTYTFYTQTTSDDGHRLKVNNATVINNWNGAKWDSATVQLDGPTELILEYKAMNQADFLSFDYCGTTANDTAYGTNNEWLGYVYQDLNFNDNSLRGVVREGTPSSISFFADWGAPQSSLQPTTACNVWTHNFSATYRLRKTFKAGSYTFELQTTSDDNYRFSINGGQNWLIQSWGFASTQTQTVTLADGTYELVIDYRGRNQPDGLRFTMTGDHTDYDGGAPDADGDGVADADDDYPNDANKAFNNYYPAQGVYGTLAYEDLWPGKGDYDMNDVVVSYNANTVTNAAGQAVEINYTTTLQAVGAAFTHAFAVQFPFAPSAVASISGQPSLDPNYLSLAPNGTEQGQSLAVVPIFDDSRKHFNCTSCNGPLNVIEGQPLLQTDTQNVRITLASPMALANVGTAPWNPFIITTRTDTASGRTRGIEVHLPGYAPTDLADPGLFNRFNDASNIVQRYATPQNHPWALHMPAFWPHPYEPYSILEAYPAFANWAQTGGQADADWFRNPAQNYTVTYP